MEELFFIFNALSSNDEQTRNKASQKIQELLEEENLPSILFEILKNPEVEPIHHFLAACSLQQWFRRSWSKKSLSDQIIFVQTLQPLLLASHPEQKKLFLLYRGLSAIFPNVEIFVGFLVNSIHLLSLETPPQTLSCALKVAWLGAHTLPFNLNKEYSQTILQIFTEIHQRIFSILMQIQNIENSPIGFSIIKYYLKTLFLSMKRVKLNNEAANLIQMVLKYIGDQISYQFLQNREFYLLIRFCCRFLVFFQTYQIEGVNLVHSKSVILEISLQYFFKLSLLKFDHIYILINLFLNNLKALPFSIDFLNMLILNSTLTENDYADLQTNPSIFYEFAYSSGDRENTRRVCFDLVNSMCMKSDKIIQMILNAPISEATLYLVSATIRAALDYDMQKILTEYILSIAKNPLISNNPVFLSTYLYLISKSMRFLNDSIIQGFTSLVFSAISCNVLVTVTNAVRVSRKMMENGIEFPFQLIEKVIEILPFCPTSDASKAIQIFIEKGDQQQVISNHLEQITSFLCIRIAGEFNKEDLEFNTDVISNSLNSLISIINNISEEVYTNLNRIFQTNDFMGLISNLIQNIDSNFSENLIQLFISIFSKHDSCLSTKLLILLIEAFNNFPNRYLIFIEEFKIAFIVFMSTFPSEFVLQNMAQPIIQIGITAITDSSSPTSKLSGCDIICYTIQYNQQFDVTNLLPFAHSLTNNVNDESLYELNLRIKMLLFMSIIVTRSTLFGEVRTDFLQELVGWILGGNAVCPYEKRLAAISIFILCVDPNLVNLAFELLKQENEQKISLLNASLPCQCEHVFPSPIFEINVLQLAGESMQKCGIENREALLSSISQFFS
ncbi:hypothetical protein TRFO_35487 [Tritrichomonas foetus]|uniref:Importin N-terminal domain-containing protein n=1 Tax=Tritrichomonas foetus TaxID=1144522 RepID=A0A1J4JG50_9EUKA|nr:hypothetical protein TRFO_35487 [Tritrichomonas foetus]|eukprot:OHS98120.1 hypothetical protein TRFO_35487 [Tritrichomonas foetus]